MKQAKFRAFDKEQNKMTSIVNVYSESDGTSWWGADHVNSETGDTICSFDEKVGVLMEFTGKEDKNNKEIFEGDVLKDDTSELHEVKFGKLPLGKSSDCICTYDAFYAKCYGKLGLAPNYECIEIANWMEIIGNIYENPEMLSK